MPNPLQLVLALAAVVLAGLFVHQALLAVRCGRGWRDVALFLTVTVATALLAVFLVRDPHPFWLGVTAVGLVLSALAELKQLQGKNAAPARASALPPSLARRLGLQSAPAPAVGDAGHVDLPGFGGDEPPRRR